MEVKGHHVLIAIFVGAMLFAAGVNIGGALYKATSDPAETAAQ